MAGFGTPNPGGLSETELDDANAAVHDAECERRVSRQSGCCRL